MDAELKEWLGITPADFMVYAAAVVVGAMYLIPNALTDAVLAFVAILLCVAACRSGMTPDPHVSTLANWAKRVSYPLSLAIVLVCVGLNFFAWN
jgi:hypothetical protein